MKSCMNVKRAVTMEVDSFLPECVLNYLLELASKVQGITHTFCLTKCKLGGRELQSIRHMTENGEDIYHKVYGFEPVEGTIRIMADQAK